MALSKKTRNPIAYDLRTPKYRKRIEEDKKRKDKVKWKKDEDE